MKNLFSVKLGKGKVLLLVVCLLLAGTGTAYGAHELTKQSITISINGKEKTIRTHEETVAQLLSDLGIRTKAEDHISPSLNTKIQDNMNIVYDAAIPVHLTLDGKEKTIWTTDQTVGALLKNEKIDIGKHDQVTPGKNDKLKKDMNLVVQQAFQVSLNDGGKDKKVWTTSTTVADFLKQQELKLKKHDKIKPALHSNLSKKSADIKITRVEKVTDVVEEKIAFDTKHKKDHSLEKGKEKVLKKGEEGKLKKHYAVVKENGKVVSKELIKEVTEKDSKDRLVAIGTQVAKKEPTASPAVSRGNESSGKEFYVASTAYTAGCAGCTGRTSTGFDLKANPGAKVIAVDPSVIPLGSKVYVEGYGYAVASDTGSAIKGNKIDVFVPSKSAAYQWGNKRVKIRVLK
ncbi:MULTISPECIES: ubiquitin-like domain-containing protein [Bacillus]|uniref:ubiquitin-like domain-containing protein n=1 Tax=Bacillus TaxID=1386 RepID=UPI002DB82A0B|nr:ubiquitin-like domain-containing protein [Bacillus safensis]